MKSLLKSLLERCTPGIAAAIRSLRNRRYFRARYGHFQQTVRTALFPSGTAPRVLTGPFKGMAYLDETVWGCITSKWLGSYEAELHPILVEIAATPYETVIDVGCAEGYYAAGLARLLPTAKVFAFDTDFLARRQVACLAAMNAVADRVEIRTFCDHADLEALSRGRTLVICDIEGHEAHLLDPTRAPALIRADILVELHETDAAPGAVEDLIRTRFSPSHQIHRIEADPRDQWVATHRPSLPEALSADLLTAATDESRATGRVWFWMRPR